LKILQPLLLLALLTAAAPSPELHAQRATPNRFAGALEAREQPLLERELPGGYGSDVSVALRPICPSTRRLIAGAGLGVLVGGAVGAMYGAIDHPGLPHLFVGQDMPNIMEWIPAFAAVGGIAGAVVGARTARCG
jgi:hypothetical protein